MKSLSNNKTNDIKEKSNDCLSIVLSIRKFLNNLADDKYKKFSSSLLPGINNVLGVRLPLLKNIAKNIAYDEAIQYLNYFEKENELYFEEIMLQGFIICGVKDKDISFDRMKKFINKINNWSVCDSFCAGLKIVQEDKRRYFEYAKKCIKLRKIYYQRFAIVLMLNYYITDEYIDDVLYILDGIRSDEYYVNMAIAWAVSVCFVKYKKKTMIFLEHNNLNVFTHNKAIQKIRESSRVEKNDKDKLIKLKR